VIPAGFPDRRAFIQLACHLVEAEGDELEALGDYPEHALLEVVKWAAQRSRPDLDDALEVAFSAGELAMWSRGTPSRLRNARRVARHVWGWFIGAENPDEPDGRDEWQERTVELCGEWRLNQFLDELWATGARTLEVTCVGRGDEMHSTVRFLVRPDGALPDL
jgi:hypothetical protein